LREKQSGLGESALLILLSLPFAGSLEQFADFKFGGIFLLQLGEDADACLELLCREQPAGLSEPLLFVMIGLVLANSLKEFADLVLVGESLLQFRQQLDAFGETLLGPERAPALHSFEQP